MATLLVFMLWIMWLNICNQVSFVMFDANLSLFKKNVNPALNFTPMWVFLSLVLQGLLFSEYPENFFIQWYLFFCPNFPFLKNSHRNVSNSLACGCFHVSCLLIFFESISPMTFMLSVFVVQIWCHRVCSNVPQWLPLLLILLANDIELNPGPPLQNQFLSFMNWNLNSLVKDSF